MERLGVGVDGNKINTPDLRINHPVDDFPLPDQVALAKKFAESLGAKGIGEVHAGWIVYPTNDCVNSNCKVLLDALPKESGATKVEV